MRGRRGSSLSAKARQGVAVGGGGVAFGGIVWQGGIFPDSGDVLKSVEVVIEAHPESEAEAKKHRGRASGAGAGRARVSWESTWLPLEELHPLLLKMEPMNL